MTEIKKCPNDESHKLEKIAEGEFFCPDCNLTFKLEQGKVKANTSGDMKGVIQKMQEDLARQGKTLDDLVKFLFKNDKESPFPFI